MGRYSDSDIKTAVIDQSGIGNNEIVAAVSGKSLRVLEALAVTAGANTLQWKSATTALTGPMALAASGSAQVHFAEEGHFETTAGQALNLDQSAAVQVGGWLRYVEI